MKITCLLLGLIVTVCADLDHATNRLWLHSDTDRDGFLSENELASFLNRCDAYSRVDHLVTQNELDPTATSSSRHLMSTTDTPSPLTTPKSAQLSTSLTLTATVW
ncbi:uncharacterized protein LOC121390483 [Gigantopelta aegis]|uniref:uncharacterized protein LOC121390483 n=1 Tax=Gigantopelta aegis TaxID=1735272 RepID=UPI001B88D533|nr:uncharacterized protein LOC121390483 [Gigantopelta aegis]